MANTTADCIDRLTVIGRRQEALIKAVHHLAVVSSLTHTEVVELAAWMKKPSDGPNLVDILLELVKMVGEMQAKLEEMHPSP